jgi:hypothetical protein
MAKKNKSSNNNQSDNNQPQGQQPMSKEESVGFHKGSINTLMAERNELLKIVQVTEQLLNAHIKELEKLGVKLQQNK